jgi:hypothetical protein
MDRLQLGLARGVHFGLALGCQPLRPAFSQALQVLLVELRESHLATGESETVAFIELPNKADIGRVDSEQASGLPIWPSVLFGCSSGGKGAPLDGELVGTVRAARSGLPIRIASIMYMCHRKPSSGLSGRRSSSSNR